MQENVEEITVDSMSEWFLESRSKMPWYKKLWYWYIKPPFSDFRYYIRKKYQKYTTGFPHEQAWNFNWWHSQLVVPRLKHLRDNSKGYPYPGLNSKEEWKEILDKIIWSFEHYDDFIDPIYSDDYDHRYKVTKDDHGVSFSPMNETGTIDRTPVEKHQAKVQEGLGLFAKYYMNLWD